MVRPQIQWLVKTTTSRRTRTEAEQVLGPDPQWADMITSGVLSTLDEGSATFQELLNTMSSDVYSEQSSRLLCSLKTCNIIEMFKVNNHHQTLLNLHMATMRRILFENSNVLNSRRLLHGSAKAKEIVVSGFDKRYAKPTSKFGPAIYFSEVPKHANDYACERKDIDSSTVHRTILVSTVILGNQEHCYLPDMHYDAQPHCHSILASKYSNGGAPYDEFLIFNNSQAKVEYVISYYMTK